MGKIKYTSKVKRFFNGKGFYLVACACMIAVGAAAWSAIEQLPSPPVEGDETASYTSSVNSEAPLEQTPVDAVVSDQPDDRPTQSPLPEDTEDIEDIEDILQGDTTQTAAPVATFFVPPVVGEIIKPFSATELQYSETFCDMRLHLGLDIAAEQGAAVTSAGEGVIKEVKQSALLGNYVIIDHGNGVLIKYCGLADAPPVKVGDTVDSKTQIGVLAALPCESVERSHLHVEVTKDDKPVDPLTLLGL